MSKYVWLKRKTTIQNSPLISFRYQQKPVLQSRHFIGSAPAPGKKKATPYTKICNFELLKR